MDWQIGAGLALQLAALVLVFRQVGRNWMRYIGAIFVVMAVLYHGVDEILVVLYSGRNPYRRFVQATYVDQFILWLALQFCFSHWPTW